MNKIRVAVVDDHPLVREGIVHVFEASKEFEIVAQGASAHEAIEIVRLHNPDVLILDLSLPGGGIAALQSIRNTKSEVKIIVLTVSDEESDVVKSLQFGANGYVLKGIGGSELIKAVTAVHDNGQYLTPSLGARMISSLVGRKSLGNEGSAELTSQQVAISNLVGRGFSNKSIGIELNMNEKTVKYHLTNLFRKLKVRSRTEVAILVQQKKIRSHPEV